MRNRLNRREVVAGGLGLTAGAAFPAAPGMAQDWSSKKVLVVYYSRTGHTRTVAEMIHRQTGGDLVELETVTPYPADYDALVAQNVEEQRSGFLPPLRTEIANIADYDIVMVGSPLWNVRLTPPVRSFLAGHDLAGKSVAPFVTYIVSGLGRAGEDVRDNAPAARVIGGLAILGENAEQADAAVAAWLSTIAA